MSNSLALFGSDNKIALKNAKDMSASLRGAAAQSSQSDLPDGGVYISFSGKAGRYSIGEDKKDADPQEAWLVNIFSFEAGWICWKSGNPAAKRMGSVYQAPIPTPDFSEHGPFNESRGEGWRRMSAFMLRSVDVGTQGYFSSSTPSALREFSKLQGEIARRLEEGLSPWPVVSLTKKEFMGQGQKNWFPKIDVLGWLGIKQVNEMASLGSPEDIAAALDRLLDEAEAAEQAGVLDLTLGGSDGTDGALTDSPEPDYIEDGDAIEDADVTDEPVEEPVDEKAQQAAVGLRRRAAPTAQAATSTRRRSTIA